MGSIHSALVSLTTIEAQFPGQADNYIGLHQDHYCFCCPFFFIVLPDMVQKFRIVIVQPKDAASVSEVNKMVSQLRPLTVCKIMNIIIVGRRVQDNLIEWSILIAELPSCVVRQPCSCNHIWIP